MIKLLVSRNTLRNSNAREKRHYAKVCYLTSSPIYRWVCHEKYKTTFHDFRINAFLLHHFQDSRQLFCRRIFFLRCRMENTGNVCRSGLEISDIYEFLISRLKMCDYSCRPGHVLKIRF